MSVMTRRQLASFEAKIDRSGACWLWTASKASRGGYGIFTIGLKSRKTNRTVIAHRLAWLIENPFDALSPDDFICHKCDNPPCCRPDHLFVGTQADNIRDMVAKGRDRAGVGERNGQSKLTEDDVRAIRASDETVLVLAARHGVSISTISVARNCKTWAHVK